MAKPALGRGLGALLGGNLTTNRQTAPATSPSASDTSSETSPVASHERVELAPLDRVRPCPLQPRKDFPETSLQELADSIREQGIVQPLIVREREGRYELIAGERRWRASQLAGLKEVPVIVREADDRTVLEMALIENLQRENLNPIEEARGYSQLIDQFQLKQEDVAAKVGKSRTVVANALRLLRLAPEIQTYLREGRLSVGHAKVILGIASEKQQRTAASRVLKDGWSVRQTEHWASRLQSQTAGEREPRFSKGQSTRDLHVVDLENLLREKLGTKVNLRYKQGKGSIEVSFFSDDELERILQILGISTE